MTDELQKIADQIKAAGEKEEAESDLEQTRVQAAGVLTAIEGHKPDPPVVRGDYGWSPAYEVAMAYRVQLEAARAALLVFAERGNWTDSPATPGSSLNAGWYGAATPWKIAQKALEGK